MRGVTRPDVRLRDRYRVGSEADRGLHHVQGMSRVLCMRRMAGRVVPGWVSDGR